MKLSKILTVAALGLCLTAQATLYTYPSGIIDATIPDGNTVGWSGLLDLSSASMRPVITDVSVKLNISGGYNGDLYAYLSYGGTLVPLLNRVGVKTGDASGYGNTGFDTLSSTDSSRKGDVHLYQSLTPSYNGNGQLTGIWEPDGRNARSAVRAGCF